MRSSRADPVIQLYPILIIAVILLADPERGFFAAGASAEPGVAAGGTGFAALLIATGPVLGLLLGAALLLRLCERRLARDPTPRPVVTADRIVHVGRWLLLGNHAVAVFFGGWLVAVRRVTGNLIVVDAVIAILPPIVGAIGLWWLHYPIERRLREALLILVQARQKKLERKTMSFHPSSLQLVHRRIFTCAQLLGSSQVQLVQMTLKM